MQSIRKRLSIILITCTTAAVLLSVVFVNMTMNSTFNKYMINVQNQKYANIVQYFEQVYKKEGKWTSTSGQEMMHEAYMNSYCLTLLDANKNQIWGMDPNYIKNSGHMMMMSGQNKGVYTSKTFAITDNGKTVGYVMVGQYNPVLLTEQDINFKNSINESILLSSLLTILITVAVSLIVSKQFSSPIKKVSDTSLKLSEGNYEASSNVKSSIIELNTLIESTDTLSEKLKHQDMLRKRLVSDISHEIRTPLNVLQNNLEAMIDGVLPITNNRLNDLNDEVIRFGKLLNNLNSLKQFEIEDIKLNIGTVHLNSLITDVCRDFCTIAKENDIQISLQFEDGNFEIQGDEDKLKQVFINLISNAVKFNRPGGSIWITLKENQGRVVAQIKDNGTGIKKSDLPYIFERLYRGDKSRQRISGSGIGLTIVKRILNLHGASIDVKSEEDKGTEVSVYFNRTSSS